MIKIPLRYFHLIANTRDVGKVRKLGEINGDVPSRGNRAGSRGSGFLWKGDANEGLRSTRFLLTKRCRRTLSTGRSRTAKIIGLNASLLGHHKLDKLTNKKAMSDNHTEGGDTDTDTPNRIKSQEWITSPLRKIGITRPAQI